MPLYFVRRSLGLSMNNLTPEVLTTKTLRADRIRGGSPKQLRHPFTR